jgi:hypothetical protein
MRFAAPRAMAGAVAMAATLCACAPEFHAVDPVDASERAAAGAVLGGALGTGLGAAFAINPAVGAVVGVESGAAIGAAIGVATAAPIPAYEPIAVPAEAVIPGFYDNWPPGFYRPPGNPETQSPHNG